MSRWRVEAFEVEIEADDWVVDNDGDRIGYRTDIGSIFIPAGVEVTRVAAPIRAGLYAERETPMDSRGFEVLYWTVEEIMDHERYNGDGSFYRHYAPVAVNYLEAQ